MARSFTRQEFYDLVWSKPITHLAKDFFLSDVAIHKICRKHQVPTPPLGYWAKKAAGKPVAQIPLPAVSKEASEKITIAASELRGETAAVAAARESARIRASDDPGCYGAEPDQIVERTLAALRKSVASSIGIVTVKGSGILHCEVAPASVDRLGRLLEGLVVAARQQGFRLEEGPHRARFVGDGETIDLLVTETVRRVKHELTPSEQAEEAAWHRKSERRKRGNPWDWEFMPRPRFAEWDFVCSGQLGLEMESVASKGAGPRKTFRDAKVQRLENLTTDIAVALAVLAVAKREARERRNEEERLRQEERRERERPLRAKHIEERRRASLGTVLEHIAQLERLRRLMHGLSRLDSAPALSRVKAFLDWSQSELSRREAAFAPDALEQRFEAENIFGDDDDSGFIAPIWY